MNASAHKPRIIFAGTPEFSLPTLTALLADQDLSVCAVYTQPDRPAGRGRKLRASPVKNCALRANIPVYQPLSLRSDEACEVITGLAPDLMIVIAYGLILPQRILDIPRLGCINVHASLLPRWRGAAPIHRAILAGDSRTGVSIMRMEAGLDTGPVIKQASVPIDADKTAGELHDQIADLGAETLMSTLPAIVAGTAQLTPQDEAGVTYAEKLDKAEAMLDWSQPADALQRQVLGLNPWPVAQTTAFFRGEKRTLKIWRAVAQGKNTYDCPGLVLEENRSGIIVATGRGELRLTEIQLPGARAMTAVDFLNAHSLSGVMLGCPHNAD